MSIITIVLPILVELMDLLNSVINFLFQMTLLRWWTSLLASQIMVLTVLLFWFFLFLLMLVFVLQWLSLHWEILILFLSQFPLTFHHIHNGTPRFMALLMTVLLLIGTVYVITWEMFHGRISLNSVLLLQLGNFVNGLRLNWCIYPTLKLSGQTSLISMVFICMCCCHSS